mmetsp:Transcript_12928/g.40820  ORF Transcript_12928/g.40820 Transcript_12928/m.40820 type:complete len:386 (-) Transcript_12928:433-1590(-)
MIRCRSLGDSSSDEGCWLRRTRAIVDAVEQEGWSVRQRAHWQADLDLLASCPVASVRSLAVVLENGQGGSVGPPCKRRLPSPGAADADDGLGSVVGASGAKRALLDALTLRTRLGPAWHTFVPDPPNRILLLGPPGTGKTSVVTAAATAAGATVERLEPSALISAYQGESERALAATVRGAIEASSKTTLLFADEIDSFCRQRHGDESETSRRLKNQLLSLLDELATPTAAHVVFVGATNYPDDLDGALLRRFSVTVRVPLPSTVDRRQILLHHLGLRRHLVSSRAVEDAAAATAGCSGADLARIVAQASLPCLRELSDTAFVSATTGEPCSGGGDDAISVHHRSIDQLVTRVPRPIDDEDLAAAVAAVLATRPDNSHVAQETRT